MAKIPSRTAAMIALSLSVAAPALAANDYHPWGRTKMQAHAG
jgi:hypothetical protein